MLVALAFIENNNENKKEEYNIFNSQYSVEEYLAEAEKTLARRKDIQKFADKMNKKAKLFFSNCSTESFNSPAPEKLPAQIEKLDTQQLIKLTSRGKIWDLGNDILYKLCNDYPDHKFPEVIVAKVWLIGRSYAAAIERGRNTKEDNDSFYESNVVTKIQTSSLDQHLKNIKQFKEINTESTPVILKTHKYLTNIFAEISGKKNRSLASKYLHFHCPHLFFLYDSRAARGARMLYPRFRSVIEFKNIDIEYAKFFTVLTKIREEIHKKEGILLSTREIDNLLINLVSPGKL